MKVVFVYYYCEPVIQEETYHTKLHIMEVMERAIKKKNKINIYKLFLNSFASSVFLRKDYWFERFPYDTCLVCLLTSQFSVKAEFVNIL